MKYQVQAKLILSPKGLKKIEEKFLEWKLRADRQHHIQTSSLRHAPMGPSDAGDHYVRITIQVVEPPTWKGVQPYGDYLQSWFKGLIEGWLVGHRIEDFEFAVHRVTEAKV